MADTKTMQERVAELGTITRQTLIETMATLVGDRPMKGKKISHQREVELWIMPTSPAAVIAFDKGASLAEAEEANRLWAGQMKADGATDEEIFQTCRKFAYQRGKFHGHGDPSKEVAWHERMALRAARYRAGETAVMDEDDETVSGGEASGGDRNDR